MIRMNDFRDNDLWSLFEASASGDLPAVERLVQARPDLVNAQYNYTPAIHFAVREGRLEVAEYLIGHGAETVDYRTYPFQDSLLTIAEDREDREMADLLRNVAAQRFPVAPGLATFLDAAKRGDRNAIRAALAVDPAMARQSDGTGDTALHRAAEMGDLEMMGELIAAGAVVDAARADGYQPVHCALHRGRKSPEQARATAKFLLENGAAYTIYLAAVLGDTAYVREALQRDRSQANHADTQWWRPITAAARRKDFEMVKLLLEHGADPNLPEDGAPVGQALWTAVYLDQFEMVKLLLEHGANPNTSPESSGSAVGHARDNPEVLALLLQYGALEGPRSPFDEFGRLIEERRLDELEKRLRETGLMSRQEEASWGEGILGGPANAGDLQLIEVLMRCGARVPDVTKWGRYYYFKHVNVAQYLLEHGMNANHRSWQEVTLLHDMAHEGSVEKARMLLDHGADVDAIDGEYRSTPLGFAARWNQPDVALLLIERGADTNRAGADWSRPLAWARRKGHPAMIELLRARGAAE